MSGERKTAAARSGRVATTLAPHSESTPCREACADCILAV